MTLSVPSRRPRAARTVLLLGLILLALFMLLPFAWVFFGAFKSQGELLADPGAWLPQTFTNVQNFIDLFVEKGFGGYMVNSLIVSVATVLLNLVFASAAGYAFAKLRFRGRGVVFIVMLASMMIPYVALVVPQFVVVVQMGLANTLIAVVLPIAVMPISVFIARQFISSIPDELIEAARIDGAGEVRIFARIVLPLLGPALATIAIMSFLNSWNFFLWPLIVAQSQSMYTLPVGLSVASQSANSTDYGLLLAGAVIVLAPVLVLFLFLQRYFVQGIAMSGLK